MEYKQCKKCGMMIFDGVGEYCSSCKKEVGEINIDPRKPGPIIRRPLVSYDEKTKELIKITEEAYCNARKAALHNFQTCVMAMRMSLEAGVKLFWWKKHGKTPIWVINGKEEFNLCQAIVSAKFSVYFDKITLNDMHLIRQHCNEVIHISENLLGKSIIETTLELLLRLGKCLKAIGKVLDIELDLGVDIAKPEPNPEPAPGTIDLLPRPPSAKGLPKDGVIVRADTHAEFLNKTFKTRYKQWYKTVWSYAPNILVWMVRFYEETQGWKNRFANENTIIEEYIGRDKTKVHEPETDYKLVVAIEERNVKRRYEIKGLFFYCKNESTRFRRIYRRVKKD